MGNYYGATAQATSTHQTLVAATADTIELTEPIDPSHFSVLNRTGDAEIYITYAPTELLLAAAVVGAAGTLVIPKAIGAMRSVALPPEWQWPIWLSVISSGTPGYSVESF